MPLTQRADRFGPRVEREHAPIAQRGVFRGDIPL
jgi:hypothetical protein